MLPKVPSSRKTSLASLKRVVQVVITDDVADDSNAHADKRRNTGDGGNELKLRVGVPASTQTLHVVVRHEHTHTHVMESASAKNSRANDDDDNVEETMQQKRELIDEATRRLQLQQPPPPPPMPTTAPAVDHVSSLTSDDVMQKLTDISNIISAQTKPPAPQTTIATSPRTAEKSQPSSETLVPVAQPTRSYINNDDSALFPVFHDDTGMFDEFNASITSFLSPPIVSAVSIATTMAREAQETSKEMIDNNTPLNRGSIPRPSLRINLKAIGDRTFDRLARLDTDEELHQRHLFCIYDQHVFSRSDDADSHYWRFAMSEGNGIWRRVYNQLMRSGNKYRNEVSEMWLAEKIEKFVRSNSYRKAYFASHMCNNVAYSGHTSALCMLERPAQFLAPTSALWSRASAMIYHHYTFDEMIHFEKARVSVISNYPLLSDTAWEVWQSCANKVASCHAHSHAELVTRLSVDEAHTPNVRFFDDSNATDSTWSCTCAHNGSVVLCSDATHKHTTAPKRHADCEQRSGADNQGVVNAGAFGAATRARWQTLLSVCDSFDEVRHSRLLAKTLVASMQIDAHMKKLLPCLLEFSVNSSEGHWRGKRDDRRIALFTASGREDYISADSHARERFYLYDPVALTLALLLFVDTRQTVGWLNAWRLWASIVQYHCDACPFCASRLSAALYRIVVYNALLPVLPLSIAVHIEQLAGKVRCRRERYQ